MTETNNVLPFRARAGVCTNNRQSCGCEDCPLKAMAAAAGFGTPMPRYNCYRYAAKLAKDEQR